MSTRAPEFDLTWHRWFAWRPVRLLDGRWGLWLYVERRGEATLEHDYDRPDLTAWTWVYRELK